MQEKWHKNCAFLRMHIGIDRHIRNRHKKNKNFKPSSKVEVNNWGKDRNVSESGSRWTRRPTSIRQRPGSGPADRLTQRQLHCGQQDCRGPARQPRAGLPPAARHRGLLSQADSLRLHPVFLFGSEASRSHSFFFFFRSLNVLIFKKYNISCKRTHFFSGV